jgi:hypothetical protein
MLAEFSRLAYCGAEWPALGAFVFELFEFFGFFDSL